MKHLDLFSGVGGFSNASHPFGFTDITFAEIDRDCRNILAHHYPESVIWDDVRSIQNASADLVTGGVPCQAFSRTNQNRSDTDTKENMWGEWFRIVSETQPKYAIAENVQGLFSDVNTNSWTYIIDSIGPLVATYEHHIVSIPAKALGAPHIRPRIFIVFRRRDIEPVDTGVVVPTWDYDNIPVYAGDYSRVNKIGLKTYGNAVVVPLAVFVLKTLMESERPSLGFRFADYQNLHKMQIATNYTKITTKRNTFNLPTPVASDYKGASQRGRRRGTISEEAVKFMNPPDGVTVYANANLAGWMMGFPPDWHIT